MKFMLDKKALENVKIYRYQTCGLTFIERHGFEYFWNWLVALFPKTFAPNLMTLLGLVFPLILWAILFTYDWTFTALLPNWLSLFACFSIFWYQTLDAIDGKQARRTNNCSPLG